MHLNSVTFGQYLNGDVYRGITSGLDKAFVIDAETCNEIINENPKSTFKNNYIHKSNYFEELVHFNGPSFNLHWILDSYGENSQITYKLSEPSWEYILISIFSLFDGSQESCPYLFSERYFYGYKTRIDLCSDLITNQMNLNDFREKHHIKEVEKLFFDLKDFLISQFLHDNIKTLKIESKQNNLSIKDFCNLADSYRFWFNYNNQPLIIKRFKPIEEIMIPVLNRKNLFENKKVSQKIYKKELLNFYEEALSSQDPFFSFISFYHIIEYFYEKIAIENYITNFKELENPNLINEEIDPELYNITRKLCQREQEKLVDVLNNFLDKEEL